MIGKGTGKLGNQRKNPNSYGKPTSNAGVKISKGIMIMIIAGKDQSSNVYGRHQTVFKK